MKRTTKRSASILLCAALIFLTFSVYHAPALAAGSNQSGVIIPLYTYPTDSSWTTVLQVKNAHNTVPIIAVINPNNGPGVSIDQNYVLGIKSFQSAGVIVLGYVATGYAGNPLASLESQVSSYKSWYAVDGIFFDEMASNLGNEGYYSTLTGYVKSLGMTRSVGNPGTASPYSYLGTVDSYCAYENGGLPRLSFLSSYTSGYLPSNFCYIAYGISTLDSTYEVNSAQYVGWLYITSLTGGNPYNGLPSYFSKEVAALDPAAAPTTTTSVTTTTTASTSSGPIWHPQLATSWQWQLQGAIDMSVNAQVFDIDMFDNTASTVAALHAKGVKVICYIDAGTIENWRPDAGTFPSSLFGLTNGWPGERWLDIRQVSILTPIMTARVAQCAQKGFDGVEFDNVDGYTNPTGFPLTAQDQLNYNEFLANLAHSYNLSVALKNDLGQVTQLLPYFDYAINEQCFDYSECNLLLPFINSGKPVFQAEYSMDTSQFCSQANAMNFNSIRKHLALDTWIVPCRDPPATSATTTTTTTSVASSTTSTVVSATSITTAAATYSVTILSVDQFGTPITGFWAILYNQYNSTVQTGFTPQTFANLAYGQPYMLQVASY